MKNIIIIMMFVVGSVTVAFAAKPIPSYNYAGEYAAQAAAPTAASNADEVHAALARIENRLNKKSSAGGSEKRIKDSMLQHAKYADNKAAEHALGLHSRISETSLVTWALIALAVVIIIGVGVFFYRRIRKDSRDTLQVSTDAYRAVEVTRNAVAENANRVVQRADEAEATIVARLDEVLARTEAGFNTVNSGIADVRTDIANINKLDPADFVFEVENHVVTYKSPAEGIAEGYYLRIYVPKDMVGDPATYCRDIESSRGAVNRECRKIMAKFFRGEFNAPEFALQKAEIEYLRANGELTWRTA